LVNDLGKIIADLEHQKAAIDRAITALREVAGPGAIAPATVQGKTTAPKRPLSPEGRKRIIAATKRRWAAKKAAEMSRTGVQSKTAAKPAAGGKTAARKGHISPEGRKKLAAAMKLRWAVKRAAEAATTAVSSKKAVPAKKGGASKKTATA
jgi:hypothetical protein